MKLSLTIFLSILIVKCAFGQPADSLSKDTLKTSKSSFGGFNSTSASIYVPNKQKLLIVKDNVTFATYNLRLTVIETEISDLEYKECNAVLKRDTATLKNIWLRDFTLDKPQNELQIGKNPIPYYISFTRIVENFNAIDNVVYTSGHESIQILKSNGEVDDPIKRNFFHMWVKKYGTWWLSTNSE